MYSVLESLLSVVYWFPFYYTFKFVFLLWLALPTFRYVWCSLIAGHAPRSCLMCDRGAEIIFRSFLAPTLGRYFGGSTAPGLRAQADKTE